VNAFARRVSFLVDVFHRGCAVFGETRRKEAEIFRRILAKFAANGIPDIGWGILKVTKGIPGAEIQIVLVTNDTACPAPPWGRAIIFSCSKRQDTVIFLHETIFVAIHDYDLHYFSTFPHEGNRNQVAK
jgi:hypothetical protein